MRFFGRKRKKTQFGLINCLNKRGLGTESRILKETFRSHYRNFDFHLYKIKAGSTSRRFDSEWPENKRFMQWLLSMDVIMTIELFMPNLFRFCRDNHIKTIWRPNHEWINPALSKQDFEMVDSIVTPQIACGDFLRQQFQLDNIHPIPWITAMPVIRKKANPTQTRFLFNAGHGGIGDRRNAELVIASFADVLPDYRDIRLTIKTQTDLDISPLKNISETQFQYIRKNTGHRKNLSYYQHNDFSLAPSKWEGLGFALLESLYSGTPVLTVDTPPMNEWVAHKQTGYLAPAHYPDIPLPIPYTRENYHGLNWVRAALCKKKDFVAGIVWLHEHKMALYKDFNELNADILNNRKSFFLENFRAIVQNC